jgi:hypothetical protein
MIKTMSYKIYIIANIFSCLFCIACKPKKALNPIPVETRKNTSSNSIFKPLKTVDTFQQNQQDEKIYKIIGILPEVKKFNKRYNLKELDKKLNIIINERPDKAFPYYWVQVGVSDQYRFQPVYNFYLNKDDFQINYFDTSTDSVITLKKWRETRGW